MVFTVQNGLDDRSEIHKQHLPVEIPVDQLEVARASAVSYGAILELRPGPQRIAFAVRDDRARRVFTLVETLDPGADRPANTEAQ